MVCCSTVCYSTEWFGVVYYGYGVVRSSRKFYGVQHGVVQYAMVSTVWYGLLWCIRHDMVYYGLVWCSMVLYGAVRYNIV